MCLKTLDSATWEISNLKKVLPGTTLNLSKKIGIKASQ
jgi:hypothetical protein